MLSLYIKEVNMTCATVHREPFGDALALQAIPDCRHCSGFGVCPMAYTSDGISALGERGLV